MDIFLNGITDGIIVCDCEWQIIFVNQRASEIIGRTSEEILERKLWDLCPTAVGSRFHRELHRAIAEQTPAHLQTLYTPLDIWFEIRAYPSIEGLIVLIQDITQRKQEEADLHTQVATAQQRCDFLLEVSQTLTASLDYETTLLSILRSVVPLLADYCLTHRLGTDGQLRPVAALHREPHQQDLVDELAQLYQYPATTSHIMAEVLHRREPIWVPELPDEFAETPTQHSRLRELHQQLATQSILVMPLIARGQLLGTLFLATTIDRHYTQSDISIINDLAHRAAMAIDNAILYHQAQESNRLKDEFLLTLSHELRTPLNAIWGWAQMLTQRAVSDWVIQQGIETIERKARELVRLIYDLLDMSSIITSQLHLDTGQVNLKRVVQEAIASLRLAAQAKSIQLQTHFGSLPVPVQGDANRLRQVVWHLLSNALKFTPSGGTVSIWLTSNDQFAQLTIVDTGTGIRVDFLPYVFDYFRQADSSTTRAHDGLGMGLALARYLIEMHGGTIEVRSSGEHQGATVIVRLPLGSS